MGDLADLDAAITAGQQAVAATPGNHPDRPGRLSHLGVALRIRFERAGTCASYCGPFQALSGLSFDFVRELA